MSGEHQIESYLLMKHTDDISIREKTILNGEKRYFIDQRENEQSVVMWPGGLYFNEAIICGHIASIYQNEFEKIFFRTARKAFGKYCLTFEKYYIGKDAYSLKGKIRYVTMNINEPKEYDLILKDWFIVFYTYDLYIQSKLANDYFICLIEFSNYKGAKRKVDDVINTLVAEEVLDERIIFA